MNGVERRVVVTGLGLLTPIGSTKEAFWQAVSTGTSGVRELTQFDTAPFRTKIGASLKDFSPDRFMEAKDAARMDPCTRMAVAAASMAVEDSGLKVDNQSSDRVVVIVGTGAGNIQSHERGLGDFFTRGWRHVNPLAVPMIMSNACSSHIAMRFGFTGVSYAVSSACASGTHAIGESYLKVAHGYADAAVAGGAEAPLCHAHFCAWDKLRVMSVRNDHPEGAVRPFSKNRDGLVLAEGSAMLVLESLEHALARSARIYGEVAGYGTSSDALHLTYPNLPQEVRAMRMALSDARIEPGDVDYINAHGTATAANDKIETQAIKEVFQEGAYSIPISSTKSMVGHSLGASGAIEFATCFLAMERGLIPPTINYEVKDPECDLDYVPNTARSATVDVAMSNSFGFGGTNAVLVARRWKDGEH